MRSWQTGAFEVAQQIHHLPLCPEPEAHPQHHGRQDPLPHRVQQRGSQAGELQQEPHRQHACSATTWPARSARTSPRRMLLPPEIVEAHEEGIIHFHDCRLLCPAHAQLRPGQSGGHAAERHRHQRHPDREAPQLLHRLQHRHPDHRPGGLQPVRRPEHLA